MINKHSNLDSVFAKNVLETVFSYVLTSALTASHLYVWEMAVSTLLSLHGRLGLWHHPASYIGVQLSQSASDALQ